MAGPSPGPESSAQSSSKSAELASELVTDNVSLPSRASAPGRPDSDADVIIVGAGPAGSTAATYLARAGLDVLLLEKSSFPRPKVCGDGLTPRGVKQLIDLGVDTSTE